MQPSDTTDTGTIDEHREDELAALVLRGRCENGDGKRGHPKRMQHTETSFEVLENAHGQDHKRIKGLRRTLGKKDLSIDSNCLVRVRSVVRTNGSRSGDKVGAGKAGRRRAISEDVHAISWSMTQQRT